MCITLFLAARKNAVVIMANGIRLAVSHQRSIQADPYSKVSSHAMSADGVVCSCKYRKKSSQDVTIIAVLLTVDNRDPARLRSRHGLDSAPVYDCSQRISAFRV